MALAAAFPAVEPLRVAQPVVELGGAVLVARVLAAAIAVFLLVTITKFKNLKMQQMLCSVGVMLMLAEIAVVAGGYFMAVVEPRFTMNSSAACACTCLHADGEEPYPKKTYKIIHDCDRLR
mgnify:CR=1 FL=1